MQHNSYDRTVDKCIIYDRTTDYTGLTEPGSGIELQTTFPVQALCNTYKVAITSTDQGAEGFDPSDPYITILSVHVKFKFIRA